MGVSAGYPGMRDGHFPSPMALPSFSPDGLDLVAFRPFEDLPWSKGILADQGQAVSSWCGVSLASVDARHRRVSKSHFWGLKPPFGHFGSDFIFQNLVAWVHLTEKHWFSWSSAGRKTESALGKGREHGPVGGVT